MADVNRVQREGKAPSKNPNLLFIFTDKQRFNTMRCYGNDVIQTPNLNALADESFVFQNAYVTQPLCTPARASIMTGLYPHTTGMVHLNIPLKEETQTIAEMVSSEYVSAYMGKWHLGDEIIPQHGFDHWVSMEDHYRIFFTKREYLSHFSDYYHFLRGKGCEPDIEWGGARVFSREMAANLPQELSKNAFLGREASRFIRENSHRPFVLYVGFMDPHSPLPDRPSSMYNPDALPTEPHFLRKPPANASQRHQKAADYYMTRSNVEGEDLRTKAGWLRLQARYWESISMVDQTMSMIFDALVESDVAENTIVVFTTDHGDMMGAHGMRTFTFLYQESLKVPLILRVPWMKKEQTLIRGHMSQIDLVPTLLDLMGEPIPSHLQGKSLVPVLRRETTLEDNAVFVETNGPHDRVPMVPGGGYPWPS